jgi:hypothetical protein
MYAVRSLLERVGMKSSGHCFESIEGSWSRTHEMIVVDLVDAALQALPVIGAALR